MKIKIVHPPVNADGSPPPPATVTLSWSHTVLVEGRPVLLFPVMPCSEGVGLDNTCKTMKEMQGFLGSDRQCRPVCDMLSEGLHFPLSSQIESDFRENSKILKAMGAWGVGFGTVDGAYPEGIEALLTGSSRNLVWVSLAPKAPDEHEYAVQPLCHFERDFALVLRDALRNIDPRNIKRNQTIPELRQSIIKSVGDQVDPSLDTLSYISKCQTALKAHLAALNDGTNVELEEHTKDRLDVLMGGKSADHKDYLETMVNAIQDATLANLSSSQHPSTFRELPASRPEIIERLSILTQFFFATVNVVSGSEQNFADAMIPHTPAIAQIILQNVVQSTSTEETSIEEKFLQFINQHYAEFGLASPIDPEKFPDIIRDFRNKWITISDSEHYDEFLMQTPSDSGSFLVNEGAFCVPLASVLMHQSDAQRKLTSDQLDFLRTTPLPRETSPCLKVDMPMPTFLASIDAARGLTLPMDKKVTEDGKKTNIGRVPEVIELFRSQDAFRKLIVAVQKGTEEDVRSILEGPYSQYCIGHLQDDPIRENIFEVLLSRSPEDPNISKLIVSAMDVNKPNQRGTSPLIAAIQARKSTIATQLIEHGANVHEKEGGPDPLQEAIKAGMKDVELALTAKRGIAQEVKGMQPTAASIELPSPQIPKSSSAAHRKQDGHQR